MRSAPILAIAVLALAGCYHATINTGVSPGATQIHRPWAPSFVYGLVPPPTINAMETCGASGVARVETQQSFLNGLVAGLTFGIFTPMDLLVTCGSGDEEDLAEVTSGPELEKALASGRPFLVPLAN